MGMLFNTIFHSFPYRFRSIYIYVCVFFLNIFSRIFAIGISRISRISNGRIAVVYDVWSKCIASRFESLLVKPLTYNQCE